MAHLRSRRGRALAVPAGLALTASLGILPGSATAVPQQAPTSTAAAAARGPELSYVVNTATAEGTIGRVRQAIAKAGGTVVTAHEQIGVIVVHSADPGFATAIRKIRGVRSAGATRTAPLKAAGTTEVGRPEQVEEPRAAVRAAAAAAGEEPLESLQWDISAIGADRAAAIDPGSRKVTVAVVDTGVDDTHPDLAPNFSARQSANCVGGVPDTSEGAWRPYTAGDYHGTHVAGSIAAARNAIGIAGVAPGVKVSSIKVSEPETSLFYAESVVCAFVFATEHGVEVTNHSYYVDPWMFNCTDDPDQRAIADAVGRAAAYAERKGAVNVASAGNANADLAATSLVDTSSPDDTTPAERTIDPSACLDIPTQLPGVVTVAATGPKALKSSYSNYGLGQIDVAGPGGDSDQLPQPPAKDGRILSTMPGGDYGYLQGTSMAGPHVAAVAALLRSVRPDAGPQEVRHLLSAQADNPGCPARPYDPDGDGRVNAACTGTQRVNSFYGHGIVDALDAVRD